jgi:hypothetical protein
MSVETEAGRSTLQQIRVDARADGRPGAWLGHPAVLWAVAAVLLMFGAVERDLSADEARIGLSALERLGPFGQVFGGWEPSILPGRVVPSWLLFKILGEPYYGLSGLVLWPGAVAVTILAVLVAWRAERYFGPGAGLLAILCLCGSALLLELPGGMMAHAMTGVFTVACLGRVLSRGSDLWSGMLAALAVCCGGWPALVLIAAPIMIVGRRGSYLSVQLLFPPAAALIGWSIWALRSAPAVVWGQALIAPLRQSPGWVELPWVLAMLLPGLGLVVAAFSGALRSSWPPTARSWVLGWAQVGLVSGLLGAFVPGMAPAAWFLLAVAVAVLATGILRAFLTSGRVGPRMAGLVLGTAVAVNLVWTALAVPRLVYVIATMGHYREVAIVAGLLTALALAVALVAAWERRRRWCVASLVALALAFKVAHAGIYLPERDYRLGQGPWARAIGQWVPPRCPIYTLHTWPSDLAFHIGRPVRQLVSAGWLALVDTPYPRYVLLQQAEFEHWPDDAPSITKLRSFEDERGGIRVLARTIKDPLPRAQTQTNSTPAPAPAVLNSSATPARDAE